MAYYLSPDRAADSLILEQQWPDVAEAVRQADPWHRPLTLHPRRNSWDDTTAPDGLDFHMIQPGHFADAPKLALTSLTTMQTRYPGHPVINAEPPYEGHGGTNWADIQRYSFWTSMLSGAAGYTYGAAGIFQANDRDRPTGNRPDGGAFDHVFWDDAMMFPGAAQLAAGHKLLISLDHHLFTSHPEWAEVELRRNHESYPLATSAFAAGIPGQCRVVYLPLRWYHWDGPLVHHLEPEVSYRAAYVETDTLRRHELGEIAGDAAGDWQGPTLPHMHDWLLVLTAVV